MIVGIVYEQLNKITGKPVAHTWGELCAFFSTHDVRENKDGLLWSPGIYVQDAPNERHNNNIAAITALVADCDGSHTLEDIELKIQSLGVRAILHSTHSYGQIDPKKIQACPGECYRVIFPLDAPVKAADQVEVWHRFNEIFDREIDQSCKDISRAYYAPSCQPGFREKRVVRIYDGPYLRTDLLPDMPDGLLVAKFDKEPMLGNGEGRPGDEYNQKGNNEETASIISKYGWQVLPGRPGDVLRVRRPGKTRGVSATIGHHAPGALYLFSNASECYPFEAGHSYTPFNVLARLECGGDYSAAAKLLAKRGFGSNGSAFTHNQDKDTGETGVWAVENTRFVSNVSGIADTIPKFSVEPKPLHWPLRAVPEFNPALVPVSLREWVLDIAERVSCPPEYIVVPVLIALSSLVGRTVGIRPKKYDDWLVVPNLWGASVGRPGVKKTPAASEALKPLGRLVAQAIEQHAFAVEAHKADVIVGEALAKAAKDKLNKSAKKGQSQELRELAMDMTGAETITEPVLKRYQVNDTTVEALGEKLKENPRGLLLNRDELTGWLRSMDRQGREQDRAFYLEAWNGTAENFTYDRIGRGTVIIPHVCVSLFGTIQPGPLGRYVRGAAVEAGEHDGLISRFQLMVYPDQKPYKRVDRYPDRDAKQIAFDVFKAFDDLMPEQVAAVCEEREIPFLRFDSQGQAIFDRWLDSLEERLQAGNEAALLEEHLSKYRSLMPSLALIFHLIDIVTNQTNPGPITQEATVLAAAWCEFLEEHARRIYDVAFEGDTEDVQRLASKLGDLPNPFTAREIKRKQWSGLNNDEDVEKALARLEEKEWIKCVYLPPSDKGGRGKYEYWKNPAIKGKGV